MKQCHAVRKLLSAYMDGSIEDARVKEHLSQCSDCAQQLQQLSDLSQRLSSMSRVKAPDDFLDGLRQRMGQPQRRIMPLKMPLGFAVLAMLVVIALSVLHREPQMQHILDDVKQPPPGLEGKAENKAEGQAVGKSVGKPAVTTEETSHDALTKTSPQVQVPTKAAKERRADMPVPATSDKPLPSPVPPATAVEVPAPAGVALPRATPAPAAAAPAMTPAAPAAPAMAPAAPAMAPAAPAMAPAEAEAPTAIQKSTAPATPAKLDTSTTPSPALKSKGQGATVGNFNADSTGDSAGQTIRPPQRITLLFSVEADKDSRQSKAVRDSGELKKEASTPHQEAKKSVPHVFERVAAMIRDNGGKVVADDAAQQRQYIDAEIPVEGYAALLSELNRMGSVQVINVSGKQDSAQQKDKQQPPDVVLLQIRFQ
ncbi:hypothetical protein MBAV_003992 [Candidatus Magnetobacterium bavaricum]|uniref:Putative zinc-finger domain-containing protein n=1 Tax=Candidatus Magnetobacterium bavaricum TaxID=29290 RepID=A0A0F3GPR9_9BACT|nr:hypothetical protein MBAV_003992 [Candidatus Magnetobacterium bavaricum]